MVEKVLAVHDRIRRGEFEDPPRPRRIGYKREDEDYQMDVDDYWRKRKVVYDNFKQACLEDVCLEKHKNADKIFAYAWDQSHSEGLRSVHITLCDLAELFYE